MFGTGLKEEHQRQSQEHERYDDCGDDDGDDGGNGSDGGTGTKNDDIGIDGSKTVWRLY